ncbi:MAG TPA: amino acid permease [Blastocatellia bacterium]|nr:amino acid permease [Blastocatellia bacterium]
MTTNPTTPVAAVRQTEPVAVLPRKIGLISAIAVLVGSTIGSGIFRSPASIATRVPNLPLYLSIWGLGGLLTLCGALTYAELSAALPRTGGPYVYLREAFGRLPAFLFGWTELLILRASAIGAIATVAAEYLLRLLGRPVTVAVHTSSGTIQQSSMAVHYIAAVAILIVAGLNIAGISLSAIVQNSTTAAKYLALALLVAAAFFLRPRFPAPPSLQMRAGTGLSLGLFGLALISILWVFDGWADLTFISGEVRKPDRNLPLALILGTLAVLGIYLLANTAYLHLLDIHQVAGSTLVAADTVYRIAGNTGVSLVSLAVMISAFGTLNGSMMTGPRIFFAMAGDGLFFKRIASVHPRLRTPHVAITLAATLGIIFVLVRSFDQLADTFVLGIWPFYAGAVAAVYSLRRKRPDLDRPYKTLGYPVTPALFLLAALYLLGNAAVADTGNVIAFLSGKGAAPGTGGTLLVFGIILAGVPAYYIWEAVNGHGRGHGSKMSAVGAGSPLETNEDKIVTVPAVESSNRGRDGR